MLFRALSAQYGSQEERCLEIRPAAKAFLDTQKHASVPFAIIFQETHAQLAGDLAAVLSPDIFGELPPDVIEAIRQHDAGWRKSDEQQIESLSEREPRTFPELSAERSLAAWQESVQHAESISSLAMVLVSRHFCLLATGDSSHKEFSRKEEQRRRAIEQDLDASSEELKRWTGALGFCDLLSLYLCSGSKVPVALPFCHPAEPGADSAEKAILSWKGSRVTFSSEIVKPNTSLGLEAMLYRGMGRDTEPLRLEWNL